MEIVMAGVGTRGTVLDLGLIPPLLDLEFKIHGIDSSSPATSSGGLWRFIHKLIFHPAYFLHGGSYKKAGRAFLEGIAALLGIPQLAERISDDEVRPKICICVCMC